MHLQRHTQQPSSLLSTSARVVRDCHGNKILSSSRHSQAGVAYISAPAVQCELQHLHAAANFDTLSSVQMLHHNVCGQCSAWHASLTSGRARMYSCATMRAQKTASLRPPVSKALAICRVHQFRAQSMHSDGTILAGDSERCTVCAGCLKCTTQLLTHGCNAF